MYRIPEKQSGSRTVLNCARSCFYQYANHLPNHLLSIELKYPDFFLPLFDFLRFILYYFAQAEFFHANLRFQKEKKLRGNVVFTTAAIIYFASLTLTCKLRPSIKPGTWNIPEHSGTFRNIPEHPGT